MLLVRQVQPKLGMLWSRSACGKRCPDVVPECISFWCQADKTLAGLILGIVNYCVNECFWNCARVDQLFCSDTCEGWLVANIGLVLYGNVVVKQVVDHLVRSNWFCRCFWNAEEVISGNGLIGVPEAKYIC